MRQKITIAALVICLPIALLANKTIIIDLSHQMGYAKENGKTVFKGRISSGRVGMETPVGNFKISEKKKKHKSTLWPKPNGGASMPYMMRLSGTSYALHLGRIADRAVSHGCVRLGGGFAQKMYRWANVGTSVKIKGDAKKFDSVLVPNTYQHKQLRQKRRYRPITEYGDFEVQEYYEDESSGIIEIY